MNKKLVYVVTNSNLGWDNVVGVFDANCITQEELEQAFVGEAYYIYPHEVDTTLDNYR